MDISGHRLVPLLAIPLALLMRAGVAASLDLGTARTFFPDATRVTPPDGDPPAATVLRDGTVSGYLFSTRAVVNSTGYSGKPLDVLVALGVDGRLRGARLLEQHEPILLIGVRPEAIESFVAQYRDVPVDRPVRLVRGRRRPGEIEAVAGATVSSLVIHEAILAAARAVATSRGILPAGRLDLARFAPLDYGTMRERGLLVRRVWREEDVRARLAALGGDLRMPGDPDSVFLELHLALATPALVGRNLLGDRLYDRLLAGLRAGDQLLFVGGRGRWSFKGTGWRRSGVFDRLRLVQGERSWLLRRAQHRRLDGLAAKGAPALRELALFPLPRESGFDPARPFRLQVRVDGVRSDGGAVSTWLALTWSPPAELLRPEPTATRPPAWVDVWWARRFEVGLLLVALFVLTVILFQQDTIAADRRRHRRLRIGFAVFTLLVLGFWMRAQLSVVNVLTFAHALMTGFDWNFFLMEPAIFVLWSYVAVAMVFWGRGVYCGWLCPFGALQELVGVVARTLGMPQTPLPFGLHEGLRTLKFVVFLTLFAVSLGGMEAALELAEVEPFKTAVVLRFARPWPYVVYVLGILAVAAAVPRAFCRYLCPLGAAIALPARLRQFEWLKRRRACGAECRICEQRCPVGAIHPEGFIHPGECIYCLECQVNYRDDGLCPPLLRRRRRREARARARTRVVTTPPPSPSPP